MAPTSRSIAASSAPRRRRAFATVPRQLAGTLALALLLVGGARPTAAQSSGSVAPSAPMPRPDAAPTSGAQPTRPVSADTPDATRAELQVLLADLERSGRGGSATASTVRTRLANGDMRPGDRFLMTLATDSVVQRELVVRDSVVVDLPPLAPLSLRGVLRSELYSTLVRHLRRYYRDPQVRVQLQTRIGVVGAVEKPGFYTVTPDATLNDVVQAAGGTTQLAKLGDIELWRYDQRVMNKKTFANSVRSGRTLAELDVRSGDEIRIPAKSGKTWLDYVWPISIVVSTLLSLLFLIRSVNTY